MPSTTPASLAISPSASSGRAEGPQCRKRPIGRPGGPQQPVEQTAPRAREISRDRLGILAIERLAQGLAGRLLDRQALAITAGTKVGRLRSTVRLAHADRLERGNRQNHHLGVAGLLGRADQLHAGLGELALRAKLTAAHAQHLSAIAEPKGRGWDCSRVAAMRATCGVMSARSAIMRWLTGSIRRKLSLATALPAPDSRVSSNSMSGAFTRS